MSLVQFFPVEFPALRVSAGSERKLLKLSGLSSRVRISRQLLQILADQLIDA